MASISWKKKAAASTDKRRQPNRDRAYIALLLVALLAHGAIVFWPRPDGEMNAVAVEDRR